MDHTDGKGQFNTHTLIVAALMAALSCVATMVIKLPSPSGGYMNLGDTVVLLSAYLLGGAYGAAAAGIGSALADIFSGYVIYAPATLVIKALMAVVASVLYSALGTMRGKLFICATAAEALMVLCYWLYDAALLGSFVAALAGVPSNLVQSAFAILASAALTSALRRPLNIDSARAERQKRGKRA